MRLNNLRRPDIFGRLIDELCVGGLLDLVFQLSDPEQEGLLQGLSQGDTQARCQDVAEVR
jgi:hypothetical protein